MVKSGRISPRKNDDSLGHGDDHGHDDSHDDSLGHGHGDDDEHRGWFWTDRRYHLFPTKLTWQYLSSHYFHQMVLTQICVFV